MIINYGKRNRIELQYPVTSDDMDEVLYQCCTTEPCGGLEFYLEKYHGEIDVVYHIEWSFCDIDIDKNYIYINSAREDNALEHSYSIPFDFSGYGEDDYSQEQLVLTAKELAESSEQEGYKAICELFADDINKAIEQQEAE